VTALGPHFLPVAGYGSFVKTYGGKAVGANLPPRLGPHFLPASLFQASPDVVVSVDGVTASALAGPVDVGLATGVRSLGPHFLVTPEREFANKGVNDVLVSLIGAEAFGRGEQLEGTTIAVTLDTAVSQAVRDDLTADNFDVVVVVDRVQISARKRAIEIEGEASRSPMVVTSRSMTTTNRSGWVTVTMRTRSVLITGATRTVHIE
jgi:hypothetical protein